MAFNGSDPKNRYTPYPALPPRAREEPMKVLCLGLSRTGTMSTYTALTKLGFPSYHMVECGLNNANNHSFKRWREAIERKYYGGEGRKLETAEEFDELLWRYQAVSDIPSVLFAPELLAAYPSAKVILTERDPESWMKSMQNSFYEVFSWRIWRPLQFLDRAHCRDYIPLLKYPLDIWTHGDPNNLSKLQQGYLEHNKYIKEVVPKERLLVFHPKNGWEPLCEFLGVGVPEEPFPRINEGKFAADLHRIIIKWRVMVVLVGLLKKGAVVGVLGLAVWAYGKWV